MKTIDVLILVGGVGLSLLVWLHDFRRLRVAARFPQAAPSRLAPEIHVLAALLSALGATILWEWMAGIGVLLLQPTIALAIAPLLARMALTSGTGKDKRER